MRRPNGPSKRSQRMITLIINGKWCTAWYQPCCGFDAFTPQLPNGLQGKNPIVRWWCPRCNVERPKGASAAGLPSLMEYHPSVSLSLWPHLDELLLDPNWADLTPKGRRCLMVFLDESFIRVLFKLDNDCLKTSAVGESWDAAMTNLEALIRSGKLVWEQDTPRQARGKKK